MPSTPSVIKSRPAYSGMPQKLKTWLNGFLSDIRSIEPKEGANVTFRQFHDGKEISTNDHRGGGGSVSVVKSKPLERGPKSLRDSVNGLLADIKAVEMKAGKGIRLQRFPDGTEISATEATTTQPQSARVVKTELLTFGPKWLREHFNGLLADVKAIQPKAGKGVRFRLFPDGTEINIVNPVDTAPGCCPVNSITVSSTITISNSCFTLSTTNLDQMVYQAGVDFTDINLFIAATQNAEDDVACADPPPECCDSDPPPDPCEPDEYCESYNSTIEISAAIGIECMPGALLIDRGYVASGANCSEDCDGFNINDGTPQTEIACADVIGTHVFTDNFAPGVTLVTTVTFT